MTTEYVWDYTYRWSGVIYAPDVPLRERKVFDRSAFAPYGLLKRRFRKTWDGRAVLLADLGDAGEHRMRKVQQRSGGPRSRSRGWSTSSSWSTG